MPQSGLGAGVGPLNQAATLLGACSRLVDRRTAEVVRLSVPSCQERLHERGAFHQSTFLDMSSVSRRLPFPAFSTTNKAAANRTQVANVPS